MRRFALYLSLAALAALPACRQEPTSAQPDRAEQAPTSTWQYDEYRDAMRGTRSWSATLQSLNQPNLQFPYEGGSPVAIRLSRTEGEGGEYAPEIVLENGQFDCSQYGESRSCLITIKADDQKPYDIRGVETACGSAKCMRLFDEQAAERADGKRIYANVVDVFRKAKRVTIELPLYGYGSFQYQFNTQGLKWPGT